MKFSTTDQCTTLRFHDALAASYAGYGGKIITSPNELWCPNVPLANDSDCEILPRKDGWWGPHEYSVMPQLWILNLPHHICIPRWPKLGKGTDSYPPRSSSLWHELDGTEWLADSLSGENFGRVQNELVRRLTVDFEHVVSTATRGINAHDKFYAVLHYLVELGRRVLARLDILCSNRVAVFTICEIQRIGLEIAGFNNYARNVKPLIEKPPSEPPKKPFPYRGVITYSVSVVQNLYNIGIPVWYLRPAGTVDSEVSIVNHVTRTSWSDYLEAGLWHQDDGFGWRPTHKVTQLRTMQLDFTTDKIILDAISEMYRIGLDRDEYQAGLRKRMTAGSTEDVPAVKQSRTVATQQTPTSKASKRPLTSQHNNQRYYIFSAYFTCMINITLCSSSSTQTQGKIRKPDTGPISPALSFSIPNVIGPYLQIPPSWLDALKRISPLPDPKKAIRFPFPPAWIVAHENATRQAAHIHNYIRVRQFVVAASYERDHPAGPLLYNSQDWRDVLRGDYRQTHKLADDAVAKGVDARRIQVLNRTLPSAPSSSTQHAAAIDATQAISREKKRRKLQHANVNTTFGVNGGFLP